MKYFKYLYIFVSWIIESIALSRWFSCWQFQNTFYFTKEKLTATLIDALNEDWRYPLLITRASHNKVLVFLWGGSQAYLQYWDIRFLEDFLGIVGGIGVYLGIWYFVTKDRKNKLLWVLLGLVSLFILIEMYFLPHIAYMWRIISLGVLLQILSLYGLWQFLGQSPKFWRYIFVSIILILSVLFILLFPLSYQNFCLKM